jgi:hypothetical protein
LEREAAVSLPLFRAMSRVLVSVVALMVGTNANSADRYVNISGIGTAACGAYLAERKAPSQAVDAIYAHWVLGFLSARNFESARLARKQVSPLPEKTTVLAYLDTYCASNPLGDVTQGSLRLARDLDGDASR